MYVSGARSDADRLTGAWRLSPGSHLDPFLAAGAGVERTSIGPLHEADFGVHAGAGTRCRLTKLWALRLDGRWANVLLQRPAENHQNNAELTLGLSLLPAPPPTPRTLPRPAFGVRDDGAPLQHREVRHSFGRHSGSGRGGGPTAGGSKVPADHRRSRDSRGSEAYNQASRRDGPMRSCDTCSIAA